MNPLFKKAAVRVLIYVTWIFVGAFPFTVLEYQEQDDLKKRQKLLEGLFKVMNENYNMSVDEFQNYSVLAHQALSQSDPNWQYFTAVFFMVHATTTIGYGNITPVTPGGQLMCVFVSLIGIPLCILAFSSVGELINAGYSALIVKFEKKVFRRQEVKKVDKKCAILAFVSMVATILVGAVLSTLRGWTMVEGCYFWFVSFSTIGFGDYLVHEQPRARLNSSSKGVSFNDLDAGTLAVTVFFEVFGMVYFVFGLCLVSSVLNSVVTWLEKRKCRAQCPAACIPRKSRTDNEEKSYENLGMDNMKRSWKSAFECEQKSNPVTVQGFSSENEQNGPKQPDG